MTKLLLCLCLGLSLVMGGCNSSPQWDKAELEQKIQQQFTDNQSKKGTGRTCTNVSLVAKTDNEFTGYATYSDGTRATINVTVDKNTGEFIAQSGLSLPS